MGLATNLRARFQRHRSTPYRTQAPGQPRPAETVAEHLLDTTGTGTFGRVTEIRSFSAQARLVADLADALKEPISKHWIDRFGERDPGVLAGSMWGHIRWKRSLGRPVGRFTNGFEVDQVSTSTETDFESPTGTRIITTTVQALMWDGPDDAEYHRVTYASFHVLIGQTDNAVNARLTSALWDDEPVRGGFRYLSPSSFALSRASGAEALVFPEIEVFQRSLGLVASYLQFGLIEP
jgi:hypothetical protein